MRLSFRFLLMLVPALAVVVLGFFTVMDRIEWEAVQKDLGQRARLVASSLEDTLVSELAATRSEKSRREAIEKTLNRTSSNSHVWGLELCSGEGKVIAYSSSVTPSFACEAAPRLSQEKADLFSVEGELFHRAVYAILNEQGKVAAYLMVIHNPSVFMAQNKRVLLNRKFVVGAFLCLVLMISVVTVLVHRWSVSQPIEQVSQAMKALLRGDVAKFTKAFENSAFAPLVEDLDKVLRTLRNAKAESEESNADLWSPTRLRNEVQRLFGDSRLCIIANREPYIHNRKGKNIDVVFPASGLVTAVEPIVRACSGLWIGHGSGTADRETADKRGLILVPPGKPEYALKRVWLTREQEHGYYYGFANEGLWPLCHIAHTRPLFRVDDYHHYRDVNQIFAEKFAEEMTEARPIALIQDYHFALLPGYIRQLKPEAITALFWHIPWPNPEVIRICPWKTELLRGMLGADLIGFHIQYHCNNFLDAVDTFLEARVDRENFSVTIAGHTCYVKPFPISVEWPSKYAVSGEQIPEVRFALLEELGLPQDAWIGLGVDRLDYTKGIVERLLAVERMLERRPDAVGKFVFIQISAPSRTHIKRYKELDDEVREVAARINSRFHQPGYEPIMLRIAHHDSPTVFRYYAAADVLLVTSLHDGMNLVAKEYVSARTDNGGALVLSSFTGAAREMNDALIVNPYDIEETAKAIYKGLTMNAEERVERMTRLRHQIASNNVYTWAGRFLAEVKAISELRESRAMGARVNGST